MELLRIPGKAFPKRVSRQDFRSIASAADAADSTAAGAEAFCRTDGIGQFFDDLDRAIGL